MKKSLLALCVAIAVACIAGQVGLPTERLALPVVDKDTDHLICLWSNSTTNWLVPFIDYDHTGVYEFKVPAWGEWYWIGLWDEKEEEYVYGKWIGHFITD